MLVLNDMTADARVEREASALAEAGHDVTVFALRSADASLTEVREGFTVRRVANLTTATWRQPLMKYLQLRERSRALRRSATGFSPDVVHAHDADTFAIGLAVQRATGCRMVADAGELYSEMLVSNRIATPRFVLRHWDRTERRGIVRADAAITVGDGIADEFARRYSRRPEVLLNVAPLQTLPDQSPLRESLGLDAAATVVIYQGLLNMGRGLEVAIEALRSAERVHLVLQGDGPTREALLEHAQRAGVSSRVHYAGMVPVHELNMWACGADAGMLLLEDTSLNNRYATPNKLFQYMMAGLPVVATRLPGIEAAVTEDMAMLVDALTPRAVALVLERLAEDRDVLRGMRAESRRLAETRYNWDIEKQKLLDVYDRLAARSTS